MSYFKKSITSVLCVVMLWHSGGYAFAATITETLNEKEVTQKYVSNDLLYTQIFPSEPGAPSVTISQTEDYLDINVGQNMFPQLVVPDAIKSMTTGDANVIRNNTSNVLSEISASNTVPQVFDLSETTPQIWARYYPNGRVGQIQVTYMRKKPYTATGVNTAVLANTVEIRTDQLPPSAGTVLSKGNSVKNPYRGVNPFASFVGGNNLYNNVSLPAFQAAVGIWARYYSTQRGYLAVAKQDFYGTYQWDECTMSFFGTCLRRRNHVEAYATITPQWSIMTASDNAPFRSNVTGYNVANCTTQASLLPSDSTFNDRRETECLAFSGIAFLPISKNSDIPSATEKVWHQHDSNEGWTMMFYIIITALSAGAFSYFSSAGYLAGGLGGVAGAGAPAFATVQGMLGTALVDGLIVASAYGLTSVIINGGNIGSVQNGWMSSVDDGVEVAGAVGNQDWSPNACIITGSRSPGQFLFNDNARYGNRECVGWLTNDLASTPGSVGQYHQERRLDLTRDSVIPNDIKLMRDVDTQPKRLDGAPKRE